ncbi:MAG TPA: hypothetical protein VHN37_10200 [Actinomycetota bacterium]|nr:hypothetical protein [Actinomycetota bacterium]
MKKILVATGALAVALAPITAANAVTVGGQTVRAGGCDITVASVSYDPVWGPISFTGFNYDCPDS